jgi:hypothetical protein
VDLPTTATALFMPGGAENYKLQVECHGRRRLGHPERGILANESLAKLVDDPRRPSD